MQEMIDNLSTYGYLILFFYSFGGGMVAILAAGVFCASSTKLDLHWCIFLAFLANTLGSTLLFILGKYYKKDIMPYFKNHRRKIALAMIKIKKYGDLLLIIQKFIYGVKTIIPIAAGLCKFSFVRFVIINTVASLIWAIALGYVGFIFGNALQDIFEILSHYPYIAPIFIIILALIIWLYLSKFSKKK
ncbi:DedA family protein [Campylobacter insulaenigrae]|uniref:DedA family protein n=1 Tax=Campylobacter insulaenigrae TaxID=260714 RepID=A0ABY3G5Y9_9BACT|nr:DedA family protein [Campylobacter insulaenigrae]MCR6570699.1 DedA family protein [Campylobacter insulaenigrae]MCR6572372.1 DedA family protein [Campylobacter insulaenigrae]MCR6573874.1 DedA family protein [Campylobacter insulaenigrae]MCR6575063.1 DedA family protein [Campylobacter insulaenigrae]MCR6577401.1 DedA family protein [Campylobacter insulaenigrae]